MKLNDLVTPAFTWIHRGNALPVSTTLWNRCGQCGGCSWLRAQVMQLMVTDKLPYVEVSKWTRLSLNMFSLTSLSSLTVSFPSLFCSYTPSTAWISPISLIFPQTHFEYFFCLDELKAVSRAFDEVLPALLHGPPPCCLFIFKSPCLEGYDKWLDCAFIWSTQNRGENNVRMN